MQRTLAITLGLSLLAGLAVAGSNKPHFATGIKIGEVTDSTAIVWARLTRAPKRVGEEAPMPQALYRSPETGELEERQGRRHNITPEMHFPDGSDIDSIEGAAPGAPGFVRVLYRVQGSDAWRDSDWVPVDSSRDFTCQIPLTDLEPASDYELEVHSRTPRKSAGSTLTGGFKTAATPTDPQNVTFTVSTGQRYPDQDDPGGGFRIYDAMSRLNPEFFVHTGDILYYDDLAKTEALARWHWQRMYSLATNLRFHRRIGSYFMKDDHDTWRNDCWPTMQGLFMGEFTFEQGLAIFPEQVPMGDSTYRTFRWGKDLQIWLVEGRDFRSPNTDPDGPDKTIWGAEQKAWFKRTVRESDATFRILISPTPVVGPDRKNKRDNHSNTVFSHEGDEIREFIASQKNMIVVCGDRHWQYVSTHPTTGVREYSCGPASDEHAGGWSNELRYDEHEYLNVIGGFLAITVDREDGQPTLRARHHGVNGAVLNEDILRAE